MEESSRKTVVKHCRQIDRNIARRNMRQRGFTQINKNKDGSGSFFAKNWRSYVY